MLRGLALIALGAAGHALYQKLKQMPVPKAPPAARPQPPEEKRVPPPGRAGPPVEMPPAESLE